MRQLIRQRLIAVPRHLFLVDCQDRTIPSDRDDVTFLDLLRYMGTGKVNIFVIGIILLTFLSDHWPIRHGRAQSQRANSHTQH